MVQYSCDKCKKVFTRRTDYLRHVNRKKPCDIDEKYKCDMCNKIFDHKADYTKHMNRKIPCSEQLGIRKANNQKCKACGKTFSSYTSLHNHVKNKSCSKSIARINIDKIHKTINNVSNKTVNSVGNVNNIDKNIENVQVEGDVKVVKFGNENLDHISDDLYKQILGRGMRSVEEFINHSNFNPDHPENHNIYIANIRDEYVVMFDGFKWSITDRDEKMEDIIYGKSDYLFVKFTELKHEMDPRDVFKFENFMKRRDDDDVLRKLKKELTLQFYNNRYLPKRMRKKMEMIEAQMLKQDVNNVCRKRKLQTMQRITDMLNALGGDNIEEIKKLLSTL